MTSFLSKWTHILDFKGQIFHTCEGLPFTYLVEGNFVVTSRTKRRIHKSQFEKAFAISPLKNVAQLQNLVQGPSYVFAILTDSRI